MGSCLRVVLGDQLSTSISCLNDTDLANDWVLMAEVHEEATYVKHHVKKIAFIFSAMRHFAESLRESGHQVIYRKFDCEGNQGSLFGEVQRLLTLQRFDRVVVTEPGEYRLLSEMQGWQERLGVPVEIRDDSRFLSSPEDFAQWASDRKELRMEFFYREMRKKYSILMEGNKPVGGKWNYDQQNRKPAKCGMAIPQTSKFEPDLITEEVLNLVEQQFTDHFGQLRPFYFAVTRAQALKVLDVFFEQRLIHFGDYQDAMLQDEDWLFHSHISFYLNCGLLLPLEIIQKAEQRYIEGSAPLNAVEGFIRQILGWREYVRGLYWLKMPEYKNLNYFNAQRSLPQLYWGAGTEMNCMAQCVKNTQENAYAHHIQRLMVLGNFALLTGLNPDEVNDWYLLVYADAYEWVELPNVHGMVLYADGGILGSKPYAAGGSYIHKMSNYCHHCHYNVKEKSGAMACPFNYLYWNFLITHQSTLRGNPRLAMVYRTLDKMSSERTHEISEDSLIFLSRLDNGEKV